MVSLRCRALPCNGVDGASPATAEGSPARLALAPAGVSRCTPPPAPRGAVPPPLTTAALPCPLLNGGLLLAILVLRVSCVYIYIDIE